MHSFLHGQNSKTTERPSWKLKTAFMYTSEIYAIELNLKNDEECNSVLISMNLWWKVNKIYDNVSERDASPIRCIFT